MKGRSLRPALRSVETIMVPDPQYGQMLVLRDLEGVTSGSVAVPPRLIPIVARFTGEMTCEAIAEEVARELGARVDVAIVVQAAEALEEALLLQGSAYEAAREKVVSTFLESPTRPASHAGGAYLSDAEELRKYLESKCLARAKPLPRQSKETPQKPMVALVSPHIDPWRGAVGYGHAYAALAGSLAPEVDTFIVFGTSHAPMRQPFALCRKAFDTPLGAMPCDEEIIDRLAEAARFDAYADEFNHKREHSIEFQAVFLKHLLGSRPARIVPVLAGLGEYQRAGLDPAKSAPIESFLDAVREVVEERKGRVVVVAGADMAHVGPRFGDPKPFEEPARSRLEETDKASLARATEGDRAAFWADVAKDIDTRRVCGLAPIYSLLSMLPKGAQGEVLHYEQTIDDGDGSIVSHAAVGFYA